MTDDLLLVIKTSSRVRSLAIRGTILVGGVIFKAPFKAVFSAVLNPGMLSRIVQVIQSNMHSADNNKGHDVDLSLLQTAVDK